MLNFFIGQDPEGDHVIYLQVLDKDGEHIRYASGYELKQIAEILDKKAEGFDQPDDFRRNFAATMSAPC